MIEGIVYVCLGNACSGRYGLDNLIDDAFPAISCLKGAFACPLHPLIQEVLPSLLHRRVERRVVHIVIHEFVLIACKIMLEDFSQSVFNVCGNRISAHVGYASRNGTVKILLQPIRNIA